MFTSKPIRVELFHVGVNADPFPLMTKKKFVCGFFVHSERSSTFTVIQKKHSTYLLRIHAFNTENIKIDRGA